MASGSGTRYVYADVYSYIDPSLSYYKGYECKIFMCPERTAEKIRQKAGAPEYGAYLANPYVCGVPENGYPMRRMTNFEQLSKVWILADGWGYAASYPDSSTMNRFAFDHGSKEVYLVFLDGHVERAKEAKLLANVGNMWGL